MRQSMDSLAAARVEREMRPRKAHVIELPLHGTQAGFDIAQTFAIGQLREAETKKLIQARKAALSKIAVVTRDAFLKLVGGKMLHHLGEDCSANMHAPLSGLKTVRPASPHTGESGSKSSNRKIWKWHLTVDPAHLYGRCASTQPDTSGEPATAASAKDALEWGDARTAKE